MRELRVPNRLIVWWDRGDRRHFGLVKRDPEWPMPPAKAPAEYRADRGRRLGL